MPLLSRLVPVPLFCLLLALPPAACAGPGAYITNILQLDAPRMLAPDGRAYSSEELRIRNSAGSAMSEVNREQTWIYAPTGLAEGCLGTDCPADRVGFRPGEGLPATGNFVHAGAEMYRMFDLSLAEAHQYVRADRYFEDPEPARDWIQARSWSRGGFDFQPPAAGEITFAFDVMRYLDMRVAAGTPDLPVVNADSEFWLTVTDVTIGYDVLRIAPEDLNTHVVLHSDRDSAQYEYFVRTVVETAYFDPARVYHVELAQNVFIGLVPEPSGAALYVAGLALLALLGRGRWRRVAAGGSLALLCSGLAQASTAAAGFELRMPALHLAGAPDTALPMPSGPATVVTEADGRRGGGRDFVEEPDLHTWLYSCTGTGCAPAPSPLAGDAAAAFEETRNLRSADTSNAFHVMTAEAVSTAQASHALAEASLYPLVFTVDSADALVLSFQGRATAQAHAARADDASAAVSFAVTLKNNSTGAESTFAPAALNRTVAAGEAAYDSGLLAFTMTTPLLEPGPLYLLYFDYAVSAATLPAVPEPAPLPLYGAGLACVLWLARRQRSCA